MVKYKNTFFNKKKKTNFNFQVKQLQGTLDNEYNIVSKHYDRYQEEVQADNEK